MFSKIISIFTILLITSCHIDSTSKETHQGIEPTRTSESNFLLKEIVEEFLSNDRVKSDIVTLQCFKIHDVLQFSLIDDYPDLESAVFHGYTSIKNHKICIVGDSIPPGFINIKFNNVPVEVVHRNKEVKNSKKYMILNSHPLVQTVCFRGKSLIKCSKDNDY